MTYIMNEHKGNINLSFVRLSPENVEWIMQKYRSPTHFCQQVFLPNGKRMLHQELEMDLFHSEYQSTLNLNPTRCTNLRTGSDLELHLEPQSALGSSRMLKLK
mmetsp:Transcript_11594/g.20971  ORF Transcript_11594/g.20971 Transcript_11594/m.20971 type:complete len:103 (+) Transcript_11594:690-998(+)